MPPRVALITGSAQGIGRAIALRLAKDGYYLGLNDIPAKREALGKVKAEVQAIHLQRSAAGGGDKSAAGDSVVLVPADVTSEAEVKTMISDTVNALGSLDVMVANAGINVTKPFMLSTLEDFQKITRVNMDSTWLCYRYAAEQMIKQGKGGRIIGASSIAGKQGWPFISSYSTSKFAIRGLTQAAAVELGQHNITVNAYAPGPIDTTLLQKLRDDVNVYNPADDSSKAVDNAPIAGDGQPEDIAGLVAYLASPEARYVTGQSVSINGGRFFD